jgi:nitrate reductase gamma subunit
VLLKPVGAKDNTSNKLTQKDSVNNTLSSVAGLLALVGATLVLRRAGARAQAQVRVYSEPTDAITCPLG